MCYSLEVHGILFHPFDQYLQAIQDFHLNQGDLEQRLLGYLYLLAGQVVQQVPVDLVGLSFQVHLNFQFFLGAQ